MNYKILNGKLYYNIPASNKTQVVTFSHNDYIFYLDIIPPTPNKQRWVSHYLFDTIGKKLVGSYSLTGHLHAK